MTDDNNVNKKTKENGILAELVGLLFNTECPFKIIKITKNTSSANIV